MCSIRMEHKPHDIPTSTYSFDSSRLFSTLVTHPILPILPILFRLHIHPLLHYAIPFRTTPHHPLRRQRTPSPVRLALGPDLSVLCRHTKTVVASVLVQQDGASVVSYVHTALSGNLFYIFHIANLSLWIANGCRSLCRNARSTLQSTTIAGAENPQNLWHTTNGRRCLFPRCKRHSGGRCRDDRWQCSRSH